MLGAYDGDHSWRFSTPFPEFATAAILAFPYAGGLARITGIPASERNSSSPSATKALQRGIRLIEWTFDPLESRNAYLNIEKLGVIVRRYYLNHYGRDRRRRHFRDWTAIAWSPNGGSMEAAHPGHEADTPTRGHSRRHSVAEEARPGVRRAMSRRACGKSFCKTFRTITTSPASSAARNQRLHLRPGSRRVFIRQIELRELRMRLLHPFETSFGVTQERRIILVKVSDGDPYRVWRSHRRRRTVLQPRDLRNGVAHPQRFHRSSRRSARKSHRPKDFARFVAGIRGHNMAKAGLETALWDLEARARIATVEAARRQRARKSIAAFRSAFNRRSTVCSRRSKRRSTRAIAASRSRSSPDGMSK